MRKTIFLILIFLIPTCLLAQDTQFTASAPKVVSVGEQFRLTYSLNKKADQFLQPDLTDFQVLMGPSTSYNQSTSIINGKLTRSVAYTYTYILQATKEGAFQIPSATAKVGKKSFQSKELTIEVVKGNQGGATQPATGQESSGQSGIGSEDLFARVLVDKREVFQGDHITATIKIYSKVNLSGFEDVKFPSFDGFLKEDIEIPPLRSLERENINGQIYGTGVISKVILYPQKSGELVIDPVEIECLIQQRTSQQSRSFFDDFFDSYQTLRKPIKSSEVKIRVKPLPAGAPAGYNGAVGNFKLSASIDKEEANVNEAITLKIIVSGNGNLKLVSPPDVNYPLDFETYDPKSSSNLMTSLAGTTGSRTFEYLMIPRFAGDFRIAPVDFHYFDPSSGKYRTLRSSNFQIKVNKGQGDESITVISSPSKEDIRFIGKDIRFIHTGAIKLTMVGKTIWGSLWYFGVFILSFLVFIVIYFFRRKKIKERANIELLKNRKANKFARKRLKSASVNMKSGNQEKFYEAVLKSLWGYLSDKLGIPVSNLSRENVSMKLRDRGTKKEIIEAFFDLLDRCEYAQYAPSAVSGGMEDVYEQAVKMITKMEQEIK